MFNIKLEENSCKIGFKALPVNSSLNTAVKKPTHCSPGHNPRADRVKKVLLIKKFLFVRKN